MTQVEQTGRTVEDAIERALVTLGVSREAVHVEILEAGTRGMLGFGARVARVRVTLKEERATIAQALARKLLEAMGYTPTLLAQEREGAVFLDIRGEHLGGLIGRHGGTLDAIEMLLSLMVAKRSGEKMKLLVDVEGYRERRRRSLEDLARRVADRVHREGREFALEPMDARERRIIHTALAEHPSVLTHSQGEGSMRRVIVAPKGTELQVTESANEHQPPSE